MRAGRCVREDVCVCVRVCSTAFSQLKRAGIKGGQPDRHTDAHTHTHTHKLKTTAHLHLQRKVTAFLELSLPIAKDVVGGVEVPADELVVLVAARQLHGRQRQIEQRCL